LWSGSFFIGAVADSMLRTTWRRERAGLFCLFQAWLQHPHAYYRERWLASIEQARASRTERAFTEGLALRAERVARLKEHAEVLDVLRWVPDKNGRLWNERAYRQTLANIAEEMGERRPEGERTERGSGQGGDWRRSRSRLN